MTIEETELSDEHRARKRAAVALGSLALVAVAIVALIVVLSGRPSPSRTTAENLPAPSRTHQRHSVASSAPTSAAAKASSSAASTASASGSATPTGQRLAGDAGNVLGAINDYRARHGVRAVSGAVTGAAVTCAANSGDGSACPSSYFWEPVQGRDGAEVVSKIIEHPSGAQFLLDPSMKRVQIGWKAVGNGEWECAIVGGY